MFFDPLRSSTTSSRVLKWSSFCLGEGSVRMSMIIFHKVVLSRLGGLNEENIIENNKDHSTRDNEGHFIFNSIFLTNFVLQVYRAVSDQSPQIVCYKKKLAKQLRENHKAKSHHLASYYQHSGIHFPSLISMLIHHIPV